MQPVFEVLRSGSWLTRERVKLVAIAVLVASIAGLAFLVVTAHGLVDIRGRPLGTDFSDVYAAGSYVLDGTPDLPFDPVRQHAREQQIFGDATPFYGWHYPPLFLFIAAALALMPYGTALIVWQAITFGLYLLMMRSIAFPFPRATTPLLSPHAGRGDYLWLLLAVAFPAVLINVGHGQNGFLTAALLGGALVQLDRRPIVSGILFGCLAYKPQFGLMIPLVLAVTGRWRVFAVATATALAIAAVTTALFGPQVWSDFVLRGLPVQNLVLADPERIATPFYPTIFMNVRGAGASYGVAMAVQACFSLLAAAAVVFAFRFRKDADRDLLTALFLACSICAVPYMLSYDALALACVAVMLLASGKLDARGQTLAKLAYWLPLIQLAFGTFHVPGPALIPAAVAAGVLMRLMAPGDGKCGSAPPAPLIDGAIPTS